MTRSKRAGEIVGEIRGVAVRRTSNRRNQMKCPQCGKTKKGPMFALQQHLRWCLG